MPIKTTESPSGTEYSLEDFPIRIHMPTVDVTVLLDQGAQHFISALEALDSYLPAHRSITTDSHLTSTGKAAKLRPLSEVLVDKTAAIWGSLEAEATRLDAVEADMLAPPALDNGHSVMISEDREVRSYWRGLPSGDRMKILGQMESEPERHTRIALALLRSPIELIDHEAQMVRAIWDARQRAKNPERTHSIDIARQGIEFARRGTLQAAQHAIRHIGWDGGEVLRFVMRHPNERTKAGFGVFGFSKQQVIHEKHLQAQLAAAGRK